MFLAFLLLYDNAELPRKNMLENYEKCPWCSSTVFEPCLGEPRFSSEVNHYLSSFAEKMLLSEPELLNSLREYRCLECGTFFLNPWFNEESGKWLFGEEKSVHRAGWSEFYSDIRTEHNKKYGLAQAFLEFMGSNGLGVTEYYEMGCPVFGFFVPFSKISAGAPLTKNLEVNLEENYYFFARKFLGGNDWGKRSLIRLFLRLGLMFTSKSGQVFKAIHHMQVKLKNRNSKTYGKITQRHGNLLIHQAIQGIKRIGYIEHDEPFFWGKACFGEITSCKNTLIGTVGVDSTSLEKLNGYNTRGRLIALHNFLDHVAKPRELLNDLCLKCEFVLVVTHRMSVVGKQHRFILNENLLKYAAENNYKIFDITESLYELAGFDVGSDDLFYLIKVT